MVEGEDYVVTDSGFEEEARVLGRKFGRTSLVLIRIRRKGCSFKGDSRNFITLCGVKTFDVFNDGTLDFDRRLIEVLNDTK
jgi:hypothetical protein